MLHQSSLKKFSCLLAIFIGFFQLNSFAQFYNNGSTVSITTGGILYADMDITNASSGSIINNGEMTTTYKLTNKVGATLSGNGTYKVQKNFNSRGTFNEDNSTLEFFGKNDSKLINTSGELYQLNINKNGSNSVILLNKNTVKHKVLFTKDNNWVQIGNYILSIDNSCTIEGYSNKRYFITNGTGSLQKLSLGSTEFTFPIGYDNLSYNPLSITENGTPDAFKVQCLEHALLQGSSGSPISNGGVDAGWYVETAIPGSSNATISAQWDKTEELTGFDKTICEVVRYKTSYWDYDALKAGSATGSTHRTISTSGFSYFGYLTVLSTASPSFGKSFSPENKSINNINAAQIKVYPTLVQNFVNVDILKNTKNIQKMNIIISDGAGKVVWQKQDVDFQSQHITLPYLAQGAYFVNVYFGTEKFVQKIIVGR